MRIFLTYLLLNTMFILNAQIINEFANVGEVNKNTHINGMQIDSLNNHIFLILKGNMHIASFDSVYQLNWSKDLGITTNSSQSGHLLSFNNGNYIAVIKHIDPTPNLHVLLFDTQGQIIWHKTFDGRGEINDACVLSNGKIALIGDITSGILTSVTVMNADGTIDWAKRVDDPDDYSWGYDIRATADGNILTTCAISSVNSHGRILFTKWSNEGNIIMDRAYQFPDLMEYPANVTETSEGDFYIIGERGFIMQDTTDVYIRKFDSNLNYIKGKQYGYIYHDKGYDIIEDNEGQLLTVSHSKPSMNFGGFLLVMRLDTNLDTIYSRYFGHPNQALHSSALYKKNDLIYAHCNGPFLTSIGTGDGHFIKTDHDFNLPCGQYPLENYIENIPDIIPSTYTGTYNEIHPTLSDFISEIPSNFQIDIVCSDSLLSIPEVKSYNIRIYPNPSNGVVCIQTEEYKHKHLIIELMDVNGKVIIKDALGSKHIIQLEDYHPGVYFLRITGDGINQTEKIILY